MHLSIALLGLVVSPLAAQGFGSDLLGPPAQVNGLWSAKPFVIRDVNGDGLQDLLNFNSAEALTYAPGQPGGAFGPAIDVAIGPGSLIPSAEAVDLDLDGQPDLEAFDLPQLVVRRGLGGDEFGPPQVHAMPSGVSAGVFAVGDLDGDGLPDALISRVHFGAGELMAAKGLGDGSFGGFGDLAQTRLAFDLQVADVDADGDLDVLEVDTQHESVVIVDEGLVSFLNQGEGTLATGTLAAALEKGSRADAAGDHDADGLPDVLAWNAYTGAVAELTGLGDGQFEPHPILELGVPVKDAKAVDLDRDGSMDVALMEQEGAGLPGQLLLQRLVRLVPHGGPLLIDPPSGNAFLGVSDLDGDGLPELAVSAGIGVIGAVLVYPNALGPIVDLGLGSPGGPVLAVTGLPAAGEVVEVSLQTAGSTPALLFVGTQALPLPFKGALLVPDPLLSVALVAPVSFSATWPASFPSGTLVYLQAFVPAGAGVAGSQAVMLVPEL